MEKLKMHSPDLSQENIAKIRDLFPGCVTEARDEVTGKLRLAVDFDQLRQELSDSIVEGPQERYRLDWPGKREAALAANSPIAKTLRPVRDQSIDFDASNNLLIEGDNLEVLKVIQESLLGRVKLIYIDPPYNTGRDFIYDDDYSQGTGDYLNLSGQADEGGRRLVANTEANGRFHSDWLSMLYPRLRLAKNLLADDGVVFVSIDDNEVDSLRKMGSEIFGDSNFVATIIWQKVYAPKNSAKWFSEDHDFILVFAKNKEVWFPNPLPRTDEMEARYKNLDNDPRGPWKAENMTARNPYDAGVYSLTTPSGRVIAGPPTGTYWRISKEKFLELDADNRIWWGKDGSNSPAVKKFLSEVSSGRTPQTLWFYNDVGHTQDAKKALLKYVPFEHTENVLNSVKPVELLQRIVQLATKPGEGAIVLDFFSGSAPTAHAVMLQNRMDGGNRRFIGVQIAEPLPVPETKMETIFDMGRLRLSNVVEEFKAEGDEVTGFRVLKLDTSNMKDVYYRADELKQGNLLDMVDNVKEGRAAEDLLFQVLVDWGVDLTLPIRRETVLGKTVLFVDENALVACFDKGVSEDLVKDLAKREPLRVVFRDSGFVSDAVKINVEQIFRQLSPTTDVKAI
ncbi:adenine-specific DNA-methyltransferase [Aminobacter niigataensis]|uniref:site-specific DNA-methyltransferase (adenine-specific) n=1 Tax=Aminobacter niigataensis TaxID=83265 RepID=A0ABR6KZG4_9HYPH|nr:site-specific DNA-methyltransferase [Aminobacter niigataensis]MBB4649909.1 adenine-specific DNA-methyltransferase [Aminobacter niigataensis]